MDDFDKYVEKRRNAMDVFRRKECDVAVVFSEEEEEEESTSAEK